MVNNHCDLCPPVPSIAFHSFSFLIPIVSPSLCHSPNPVWVLWITSPPSVCQGDDLFNVNMVWPCSTWTLLSAQISSREDLTLLRDAQPGQLQMWENEAPSVHTWFTFSLLRVVEFGLFGFWGGGRLRGVGMEAVQWVMVVCFDWFVGLFLRVPRRSLILVQSVMLYIFHDHCKQQWYV